MSTVSREGMYSGVRYWRSISAPSRPTISRPCRDVPVQGPMPTLVGWKRPSASFRKKGSLLMTAGPCRNRSGLARGRGGGGLLGLLARQDHRDRHVVGDVAQRAEDVGRDLH